ncbi:cupin domain-containing protein [Pandoraea pneumonica]|uniref:cupin domain-containing protein n=1 Tax=Pandoraea pneumonica TaxID=2508299 RepID=UPI003CFB7BC3
MKIETQNTANPVTKTDDLPPRILHIDDMEWETIRWPGETGKMLVHPTLEDPTLPNAGLLRLEPGAHHPWHRHDFAQIWYILEGEFVIGGHKCGPGTVLQHGDPHCEEELTTETGGLMFIVQYPGPTTGGRVVYDKRFNMAARKSVQEERIDV